MRFMDMKIIIKMCFWGGLQFSMPISAQTPVQTPLTYEMLLPDFQKNKPDSYGTWYLWSL